MAQWYFPVNNSAIQSGSSGSSLYRNRGPSAVRLNRRHQVTAPSGVYRCEIPDASGTSQSIYVGIYPQGDGEIKSLFNNVFNYPYYPMKALQLSLFYCLTETLAPLLVSPLVVLLPLSLGEKMTYF